MALTGRFNDVCNWVKTAILTTEALKQRITVFKRFLSLANSLKTMKNYNGTLAVFSGLESGAILRMKATIEPVLSNKKYSAMYNDLKALLNVKNNYSRLRDVIKEDLRDRSRYIVIPYLGQFLTDLLFIEEGNPRMIQGPLSLPSLYSLLNPYIS